MIEVYDKKFSTDGLMRVCWIVAIPCLLCTVIIIFTYTNEEIGQSFLLKFILFLIAAHAGLLGILRILQSVQANGSIGETSYLRIKDDSMLFLNRQVRISEIQSVIVRIRSKKEVDYFSGNNYLEIKTRSDKHELGLLISNDKGIDTAEEMIKNLKEKKVSVTYEKYV